MSIENALIYTSNNLPLTIQTFSYQTVVEHWHPETEILYVLSGSSDIIIEDRSYHLQPDDVCLINSNAMHKIIPNNAHALSLRFQPDQLEHVTSGENLYFDCCSSGETHSQRYDRIRQLLALLVKAGASTEDKYRSLSLLYELIGHLKRHFQALPANTVSQSSRQRVRMAKILSYIDTHYQDRLSLKELAQKYDLTVPYLSSLFVKRTGMTFLAYYNNVRLTHAVNDMLSSNDSIEEIAINHGFHDTRAFTSAFKKKYNCLPSAYRKENQVGDSPVDPVAAAFDRQHTFTADMPENIWEGLARYLNINSSPFQGEQTISNHLAPIDCGLWDVQQEGTPLRHNFHTLCCVGSARQFLYAEVQDMIRQMQRDIGYQYVKFHGILSDEMMVYMEDSQGREIYSFTLVDKILDFLASVQLKPLIQLSFMPRMLASDPEKLIDMWYFNTSPPKSIEKWTRLVSAFVRHLISRYGMEEVQSWLFCVWNEPDSSLDAFAWKDPKTFYRFYMETYQTVKNISPDLKFGTPSLLPGLSSSAEWIDNFFSFCIKHHCVADFLNIHFYDNDFSSEENTKEFDVSIQNQMISNVPLNKDSFAFSKFISRLKHLTRQWKISHLPIYLTEWNLTVSHRDLINDTCFKACYLTKNLLENYDRLESFGYWCLTDFIEELQLPNALYHGGLGMFTYNAIPKAHYNAFCFMTHLGDTLVGQGKGYFITKAGNRITIILYNYEHYSQLFASGVLFDMSDKNRYTPFSQMAPVTMQMQLENLPGNTCLIKEQFINQEKGSSYDIWVRMGAQPLNTPDTIDFLRQQSKPGMYLHREQINDGTLIFRTQLAPLEVRLVEIEPTYS